MRPLTLSPQQHALLAWVLLLASVLVLAALFIAPALFLRHAQSEKITAAEMQLSHTKHTGSMLGALQKEIALLKSTGLHQEEFLPEKAPALAAADVQQLLKTLIATHQGEVVSTQYLNDDQNELYPKVVIKVQMRSNLTALTRVFHALEFSQPRLFIDNLSIQKRSPTVGRSNQKDADSLDCRFDVSGYIFNSNL